MTWRYNQSTVLSSVVLTPGVVRAMTLALAFTRAYHASSVNLMLLALHYHKDTGLCLLRK